MIISLALIISDINKNIMNKGFNMVKLLTVFFRAYKAYD